MNSHALHKNRKCFSVCLKDARSKLTATTVNHANTTVWNALCTQSSCFKSNFIRCVRIRCLHIEHHMTSSWFRMFLCTPQQQQNNINKHKHCLFWNNQTHNILTHTTYQHNALKRETIYVVDHSVRRHKLISLQQSWDLLCKQWQCKWRIGLKKRLHCHSAINNMFQLIIQSQVATNRQSNVKSTHRKYVVTTWSTK